MKGLRRVPKGTLALVVVAVVLTAAGVGFWVRAGQLRDVPAAGNRAIVDERATTQVIGDVSNALTKVFSYSGGDVGAADRAAEQVLAGKAARGYESLFPQVREHAGDQELEVHTKVVTAGVVRLDGDRATVLVFLDQTYRRGDDEQRSAPAQLLVSAKHQGGHWVVTAIKAR